jgi:hypothetical protein
MSFIHMLHGEPCAPQSLRTYLRERTRGELSLPLALENVLGTDSEALERGLFLFNWVSGALVFWALFDAS